jgi:hypothetical protein
MVNVILIFLLGKFVVRVAGMAEQVLGVFPCIVRRLPSQLFVSTDRIIVHADGTSVDESEVIPLSQVTGFMMNKPKAGLPQDQQKALIKVSYRDVQSAANVDRVLDFTGDEKFANCTKCESLLREYAGDKAEERRLQLIKEEQKQASMRQRFLDQNPEMLRRYHYLTGEGGLSPDEFWEQHDEALRLMVPDDSEESTSAVPIPLRRPDILQTDLASNIANVSDKKDLLVTPEQAAEIFVQFPKAKELYERLVPTALSEKNFWRRFFHSQYFNLNQGSVAASTSKQDTVFDSLLSEPSENIKPGSLAVDPEIDLTTDFLIADSGVFAFRDSGADSSQKPEVGGNLSGNQATAHGMLVKRFNTAGVAVSGLAEPDEVKALQMRKLKEESHELSELTSTSVPISRAVTKAEIERLRRTRPKHPVTEDRAYLSQLDQEQSTLSPGMSGAAAALIHLTQELVVPIKTGNEFSKRIRRLTSSPESAQVDEYMERAIELLRYFYSSKLIEIEKRSKALHALEQLRGQIANAMVHMTTQTEWSSSFNSIEGMIATAEDVNASLISSDAHIKTA